MIIEKVMKMVWACGLVGGVYYGENSEVGLCLRLGFVVGTHCENCCKSLRHLTTTINSLWVYLGCGVGIPRGNRENSENGLGLWLGWGCVLR